MTSSPADRTAPVLPSQSRLQNPSQHRRLEAAPANLRQRGGQNLFEPQVYPETSVRAFDQVSGHVTDPDVSEFGLFILETLVWHNYGQCLKCLFLVFFKKKKDWITEVLRDKVKGAFKYHWLLCKVILKISCSAGLQ